MPTFRQSSGTQREVHLNQQNQENACHCHNRRRARPLPLGNGRRRSSENRPQDPESTHSRRNSGNSSIKPPETDAECVSTVEPSIAHSGQYLQPALARRWLPRRVPLGVAPEKVPPERASPWRTNECPSVVIVVDPGAALLLLLLVPVSVSIKTTTSVGTSTSRSTICVAARAARRGRDGNEILGTAIICSGTAESTGFSTATNWSTICGSGTPRAGTTGATSPNCSAVCRRTRSCGRGSARVSGRTPPGPSSDRLKSSSWGVGGSRVFAVKFCSRSHSPALAFFSPRRAEWCYDVARATAIDSCRHHERSRRCLRR